MANCKVVISWFALVAVEYIGYVENTLDTNFQTYQPSTFGDITKRSENVNLADGQYTRYSWFIRFTQYVAQLKIDIFC